MNFSGTLLAALPGTLLAATAAAASAYVSDELVLGVFAEQNGQGQRLATLHSGASVETLSVAGEYTQVRLNDGQAGWVKSTYLTTREPATSRLRQLEEELDRIRATTPALAEAAARSEAEHLKGELAATQSALEAARAAAAPAGRRDTADRSPAALSVAPARPPGRGSVDIRIAALALAAALALGFWSGYAALARRVKHKFGGIKVY